MIHCQGRFDNSADNPNNPDPFQAPSPSASRPTTRCSLATSTSHSATRTLPSGAPTSRPLDDGQLRGHVPLSRPSSPARKVELACKALGWEKNLRPMDGPDADGRYAIKVTLPAGVHEYKFVIDGNQWIHDPANPDQNGYFHDSVLKLDR